MRRTQPWTRGLLIGLVLLGLGGGGLWSEAGAQQADPDNLKLSLAALTAGVVLSDPNDPLPLELTWANLDALPVATSAPFSDQSFQLFIVATGPAGQALLPQAVDEVTDFELGPAPVVVVVDPVTGRRRLVQALPVELLPGTSAATPFVLATTVADFKQLLPFDQTGGWTLQASVPFRAFDTTKVFVTATGDPPTALLDCAASPGTCTGKLADRNFQGVKLSNPIQVAVIGDLDADGYCFPTVPSPANPLLSCQPTPDCEDRPAGADGLLGTADDGATINPGQVELPGDGLDNDCNPLTGDVVTAQGIQAQIDVLEAFIQTNPGTPLADKLDDAVAKLKTAQVELAKTPPDNQAAMGNLEGAVGDLESAVQDGLLTPGQGTRIMDALTEVARQLAVGALLVATAQGGDPSDISDAQQSLANGDVLRAAGAFKAAVAQYKDALSKAEGALP